MLRSVTARRSLSAAIASLTRARSVTSSLRFSISRRIWEVITLKERESSPTSSSRSTAAVAVQSPAPMAFAVAESRMTGRTTRLAAPTPSAIATSIASTLSAAVWRLFARICSHEIGLGQHDDRVEVEPVVAVGDDLDERARAADHRGEPPAVRDVGTGGELCREEAGGGADQRALAGGCREPLRFAPNAVGDQIGLFVEGRSDDVPVAFHDENLPRFSDAHAAEERADLGERDVEHENALQAAIPVTVGQYGRQVEPDSRDGSADPRPGRLAGIHGGPEPAPGAGVVIRPLGQNAPGETAPGHGGVPADRAVREARVRQHEVALRFVGADEAAVPARERDRPQSLEELSLLPEIAGHLLGVAGVQQALPHFVRVDLVDLLGQSEVVVEHEFDPEDDFPAEPGGEVVDGSLSVAVGKVADDRADGDDREDEQEHEHRAQRNGPARRGDGGHVASIGEPPALVTFASVVPCPRPAS